MPNSLQLQTRNSVKESSLLWSPRCVDKFVVRLNMVDITRDNTTINSNSSIPRAMGIRKMSLGSRYNTPRGGVVGLPGDEGNDHDDEGREDAEGMVVELESKPELERGGKLIGRGG